MILSKSASRLLRLFLTYRDAGYQLDSARRALANRFFNVVVRQMYGKHLSFEGVEEFAAEEQPRWSQLEPAEVKLTIVVVTYRQPIALECLLASLCCQTLQNFEVLVIHDGEDAATREVAERYAKRSDRYKYQETAVRHNDYGHTLRAMGIDQASAEYLLITNGDNYYPPRFTEFVFEAIDSRRLDLTLWDLVHSYTSPGRRTLRCYTPLRVFPVRYLVDMGSFIVRTTLAKRVGFTDRAHTADATYLESILSLTDARIRIGKVEKSLMVHN